MGNGSVATERNALPCQEKFGYVVNMLISFNSCWAVRVWQSGGALIMKDPPFKKKAVFLSTQAKDDAPHYEHTSIGYNYRMSNICAGIGRGQMEVLPQRIEVRKAHHEFYKKLFAGQPRFTMHSEPDSDFISNHWLNIVSVNPCGEFNAEYVRLRTLEANIETRPIWKPMHMQPVFKNALYFGGNFAERLFATGLCLPSGSNLSQDDMARITEVFSNIFGLVNKS